MRCAEGSLGLVASGHQHRYWCITSLSLHIIVALCSDKGCAFSPCTVVGANPLVVSIPKSRTFSLLDANFLLGNDASTEELITIQPIPQPRKRGPRQLRIECCKKRKEVPS